MTDEVQRWLEPDSDAPPGARELLAQARTAPAMSQEERERSAVRVATLAAGGAALGGAGLVARFGSGLAKGLFTTKGLWTTKGALWLTLFVVGSGLAAAGVFAAMSVWRFAHASDAEPTRHQPGSRSAAVAAPPPSPPPAAPAVNPPVSPTTRQEPEPPQDRGAERRAVARTTRRSVPPRSNADALLAEARVLDRARGHLQTRPQTSLRLVRRHRRQFPDGQLRPEAEVIAVDALMRLGQVDRARRRAMALRQAQPGTVYAERVTLLVEAR